MIARFHVRDHLMTFGNFLRGRLYNRQRDLHGPYKGQEQGGIITPSKYPVIFAITGESGIQHGYHDGWTEDHQVFLYYGEGQVGDMVFTKGNAAIRDHLKNGEDLLLFEKHDRAGTLRFLGQFICVATSRKPTPDRIENIRSGIVFHLVPAEAAEEVEVVEPDVDDDLPAVNLAELRAAAIDASSTGGEVPATGARRRIYQRSQAVRRYVLARANGFCECCKEVAPFLRADGQPYLEPHHIRRVSDGGPDDPRYVAGVCPTCHRRIHHGADGPEVNARLGEIIMKKEREQNPGDQTLRRRRKMELA